MINPEPTVSVVDDDADFRQSLEWMLRKANLNVKSFTSAEDFLENYTPDQNPGCVLLDLSMPGLSGLQLQERMIENDWMTPVIILTGNADVPSAVTALEAGAITLLEKPFKREDLLDRIHEALGKDTEERSQRATRSDVEGRIETLTRREREVMALIVDGKTTKQIGNHLGASPRTIEIHRSRVMKKMRVQSTAQLAALTVRYGMVVSTINQSDPSDPA